MKKWHQFPLFLRHERACRFYETSMYFLAKVVCEVLPVKLGPVVFFFPILYAMTGLRRSFAAMFFWEATCLCMGAASSGIVIFCVLLFNHVALGYVVSGIILSFMMVCSSCLDSLSYLECPFDRYLVIFYSRLVVSSWMLRPHGGWVGVATSQFSGTPSPQCPSTRFMGWNFAPCQRMLHWKSYLVPSEEAISVRLHGKSLS